MKWSRLNAVSGFFLAAMLSSPALGSIPPQPGTVNYIEGQASIGTQTLTERAVGNAKLGPGQSLSTDNGRAEILLLPGMILELDAHSSVQMVSPDLANTIVSLEKGRAMVDVTAIQPENNVRINMRGASTQLMKAGLYELDADRGTVRVFDGKASIQAGSQRVELNGEHELNLSAGNKLKAHKFDKKEYADDFFRWTSLRASYLAEANMDAARSYAGAYGWSPTLWAGSGWYWDPWYSAYTFVPGDGIFYDPFGWGFYSPWYGYGLGFGGYGGYGFGYGGYGYGGRGYHHFGPGYHPSAALSARSFAGNAGAVGHAGAIGHAGAVGHAYSVRGGSMGAMARGGGFGGGGFAGGGFHGGGFGGGGFHGGGFGGGGHGGGGGGHGR